jgi:hypothetical protein
MDADHFAEWYRRQGHHVLRSESSYWFDAAPSIYQALPFGWLIEPSQAELRELMHRHSIFALRYSTSLTAPRGKVSYHVTLQRPYNLELLRSQARNAVRRGLAKCQVEALSFERLAIEGWNLQRDTLDRQGRSDSMDGAAWRKICMSAADLEGMETWGAVVEGELAAAVILCRVNDVYYVPYACSHRKYLDNYVNNALFYSVSSNLLTREGTNEIFFTVQSLDAPKSVDDFKFRMGLHAKAVRQRVVFNPLIEVFINRLTHEMVNRLFRRYPHKSWLAKAEGMIRFYLEGKIPINKQEWPECVEDCRQAVVDKMADSSIGDEPGAELPRPIPAGDEVNARS